MNSIDVAKGIGILLVVIGHTDARPWVGNLIYQFHMPFFFILSGYLFRPTTMRDFLQRKTVRYLLPYFSYLVLFALAAPKPAMETILGAQGAQHPVRSLLIGGVHLETYATPFWFPTALYITALLATGVALVKRRHFASGAAIVCLLGALINQRHHTIAWPFAANVALMGYVFFFCGQWLREHLDSKPLLWWAGVLTAASAGAILFTDLPFSFDMKHAYYGIFPISLVMALSMSVMLLALSQVAYARAPVLAHALIYVGQASMTIMYLHQFFQLRLGYTRFHDWHLLRIAVGVLIPLILHAGLMRVGVSRVFFCGLPKPVRA